MNTIEKNPIAELESVLTFLGVVFIDYKGHRTTNGHKTAKTIGETEKFFGRKVSVTGQFIEDLLLYETWRFNTSWRDSMLLVEKIEEKGATVTIGRMFCEIEYEDPFDKEKTFSKKIVCGVKINAVYATCVEFILWFNKNKK